MIKTGTAFFLKRTNNQHKIETARNTCTLACTSFKDVETSVFCIDQGWSSCCQWIVVRKYSKLSDCPCQQRGCKGTNVNTTEKWSVVLMQAHLQVSNEYYSLPCTLKLLDVRSIPQQSLSGCAIRELLLFPYLWLLCVVWTGYFQCTQSINYNACQGQQHSSGQPSVFQAQKVLIFQQY